MQANYWASSRSPLYGLVAVLPLFVLYEVLVLLTQTSLRNGAEVLLLNVLPFAGQLSLWVIKLAAIAGLGALFFWREPNVRLNRSYLLLLFGEAALYSLLLGSVVLFVLRGLSWLSFPNGAGLLTNLMLSFGAGLYEELLFRVLLFGGLWWALRTLSKKPVPSAIAAAIVSSLLFSAVHHIGPLGEPWAWYPFAYRTVSGLAFCGLFVARGFGITAVTHALYDVWITLGVL